MDLQEPQDIQALQDGKVKGQNQAELDFQEQMGLLATQVIQVQEGTLVRKASQDHWAYQAHQ